MLWIKAFHFIAVVLWFAGLFYLPRLFVYHATCKDPILDQHFQEMERKLYRYIMTPAALLTLFLGVWLVWINAGNALYGHWLLPKLVLVFGLYLYHFYLGFRVKDFIKGRNHHSSTFYRWLNELPTLALIGIVLIVILKPWG